jgi:hypothetical protein
MSYVHPAQRLLKERSLSSSTSTLRRNLHGSIRLAGSIETRRIMGIDDVDGIETTIARTAHESLGEIVRGVRGISLPVQMHRMLRLTFPHILTRRDVRGLKTLWQRNWRAFCILFFDSAFYFDVLLPVQGFILIFQYLSSAWSSEAEVS